ncbi:uncharacterized protein LOC136037260 [Artemia franciscana]|uniref:uncharacterized protein LOC136037260 n=1 Tax=Artemia franciscana TaxID=6661 RepID=UPI0032DA3158
MIAKFTPVLLFFGIVSCYNVRKHKDAKVPGNANDYLDYVLSLARPIIASSGLDPIFPLPEVTGTFENTILGVHWHGNVALYNGFLFGLSTLTRAGDATLEVVGFRMDFTGDVGLSNVQAGYRCHYDVQGVGDDADINVLIPYVSARFSSSTFLLNTTTTMNSFQILNIGSPQVTFQGFDGLDWVAEAIADIVLDNLGEEILEALESGISDILECIISVTSSDDPNLSIDSCVPVRNVKVIRRN